jgi:hypothetical protein
MGWWTMVNLTKENSNSTIQDVLEFYTTQYLTKLLDAPKLGFDKYLRSCLPDEHGIYRISLKGSDWKDSLRAGRTKTAQGGIRQRVYGNHYMGDQKGNLRQQLVESGYCINIGEAKVFLQESCEVQYLIIPDYEERKLAEYFVLAILRPFCSN